MPTNSSPASIVIFDNVVSGLVSENIQDALNEVDNSVDVLVTVSHTRNTDTILDDGGVNEVSAAELRTYLDKGNGVRRITVGDTSNHEAQYATIPDAIAGLLADDFGWGIPSSSNVVEIIDNEAPSIITLTSGIILNGIILDMNGRALFHSGTIATPLITLSDTGSIRNCLGIYNFGSLGSNPVVKIDVTDIPSGQSFLHLLDSLTVNMVLGTATNLVDIIGNASSGEVAINGIKSGWDVFIGNTFNSTVRIRNSRIADLETETGGTFVQVVTENCIITSETFNAAGEYTLNDGEVIGTIVFGAGAIGRKSIYTKANKVVCDPLALDTVLFLPQTTVPIEIAASYPFVAINANTSWITNDTAIVEIPLPITGDVLEGHTFEIIGKGTGGWRITLIASQTIYDGATSIAGVLSTVDSVDDFACIRLRCLVDGGADWVVDHAHGAYILVP